MERPILFSGPMVRAILDGKKSMTRRIVRHRNGIGFLGGAGEEGDPALWGYTFDDPAPWGYTFDGPSHYGYAVLARGFSEREQNGRVSIPSPYGEAGDTLWVRETWRSSASDPTYIIHAADLSDYEREEKGPWRPGIFMPRWASRLTLRVTSVRVERLQDITEADATAEGVVAPHLLDAFSALWDGINGDRACWASNPWVWVVSFERVPSGGR